jgi:hypothetical protein
MTGDSRRDIVIATRMRELDQYDDSHYTFAELMADVVWSAVMVMDCNPDELWNAIKLHAPK